MQTALSYSDWKNNNSRRINFADSGMLYITIVLEQVAGGDVCCN